MLPTPEHRSVPYSTRVAWAAGITQDERGEEEDRRIRRIRSQSKETYAIKTCRSTNIFIRIVSEEWNRSDHEFVTMVRRRCLPSQPCPLRIMGTFLSLTAHSHVPPQLPASNNSDPYLKSPHIPVTLATHLTV